MQTTGCRPPIAIPAADVTACCSAIPTSNTRSGNSSANGCEPDRPQHRGGHPDHVGPLVPEPDHLLGEDVGPGRCRDVDRTPGDRVDHADLWNWSASSSTAGRVAASLLGQAVHDHRRAEVAGLAQRALERRDVMPVDRADVLQPEVLEHHLRLDQVLEPLLHAVQRLVDRARRRPGCAPATSCTHSSTCSYDGESRSAARCRGQAADGRRVRAAVVVDDDDDRPVRGAGDGVDRLPAHAAGQRAVADDRRRRERSVSPRTANAFAMPSA